MVSKWNRVFDPEDRGPQRSGASAPHVAGAEATPAFADAFVETSHATIAVRQSRGRGLPVVLLHESSCGKDVFDAQLRSGLGRAHRLIALDLPGHGASSDAFDPERTYSLPGYADTVLEVLEVLGIDQVAAVGWSLGGHVALELMASFPGLVGVMISGAMPIGHDLSALRQAVRPLGAFAGQRTLTEDEVVSFARAAVGGPPDPAVVDAIRRADGCARSLMLNSLIAGDYADERLLVEGLQTPVAIVNGADDPLIDCDALQALAYAALWRDTCHLIPRAGHAPFLDAPQLFNLLLSSFLSDMDARASLLADDPPLTYSA